jgi:hypothetical protein
MATLKTKTKTWKIGEVCQGGIITVEVTGKVIAIIGKEWDMSKGTRRGSDQKGAKEFTRGTMDATSNGAERKCDDFLCDLTTSYYAGQVMDWIKTQVEFKSENSYW